MAQEFDLTTLPGLLGAVEASGVEKPDECESLGDFTGTYCTVCAGFRRMRLEPKYSAAVLTPSNVNATWPDDLIEGLKRPITFSPFVMAISGTPPLLRAVCLQCTYAITLLVALIDRQPQVIALHGGGGGLATEHTPKGVAYYVNQAYRAQSIGANSAAVTMYRSALEHLLHEQGFQAKRLVDQIDALLAADPGPPWRTHLDEDHLHILRKLGNLAVHVNDGDVGRQHALDATLVHEVHVVFVELLDEVYEQPAKRAARKAKLQAAFEAPATGEGEPK